GPTGRETCRARSIWAAPDRRSPRRCAAPARCAAIWPRFPGTGSATSPSLTSVVVRVAFQGSGAADSREPASQGDCRRARTGGIWELAARVQGGDAQLARPGQDAVLDLGRGGGIGE